MRNLEADLSLDFRSLGVAMPETRAEFRRLVESQDLATERGRRLFSALIDISDSFAALTESTEELERQQRRLREQELETINFRNLRAERFARSAEIHDLLPPANDNLPVLRELVVAVNQGNLNLARQLADLVSATARTSYEPSQEEVA